MKDKYYTIKRFLLKEEGFEEEVVNEMSKEELLELWDHYHEGYENYY